MFGLTDRQVEQQLRYRRFADEVVRPAAGGYDQAEYLPIEIVRAMASAQLFATPAISGFGGQQADPVLVGLLHEEIGRACSSVRSLLTVQGMVWHAIARWGNSEQASRWCKDLREGAAIGAFCLSEPGAGSDINSIRTVASRVGSDYVLNGRKKWISFGQLADVLLVIASSDEGPCSFVLDSNLPGISRRAIHGMLGLRASMLAEIEFDDCRVPADRLIGRPGTGLSHIATTALDYGRFTVAWGCVGLAAECLDASMRYAREREQFGAHLIDHALIQRLLTHMIVGVKTSRLLCLEAAMLRSESDPSALAETSMAKFHAAATLQTVADSALQIHGAVGAQSELPISRYVRDARMMQIIEGTPQIHEIGIARHASGSWQ